MIQKIIKLRILGKTNQVEEETEALIKLLENNDYQVIQASKPLQCRSPNNDESRIYLTITKTNNK
ncbi:hypothetical protein [Crocosphaera sp. Alani8]|uniref:hypothetical protein n=1 Tax=Crocosphaera sp. Alani8 TaxID=3038952 RepID=UPI00313BBAFE